MVGVAGSIPGRPNNTVEVGDVVVSQPAMQGGSLYVHCTGNNCGRGGRWAAGEVGDVVVSQPAMQGGALYVHCTGNYCGRGGRWEGW